MSAQDAQLLDHRRDAAAREVLAALAAGDGLVALTGPAHVGKTAVLDVVASRLEGAGVRVLRVAGAAAGGGRLSLRALLAQVAGRDIKGMGESAVEELLDLLDGTGAGVVVAVDDAQNLQTDAAEFFRLLAMLGRGQARRSRVVFAGRPEFWDVFPDDASGRARLVGTRVVLAAEEEAEPPVAPAPAPEAVALPPRRHGVRAMVLAGLGVAGLVGLTAAATVPWQRREPRVTVPEPVRIAEPASEAQPGGFVAGGVPAPPPPPMRVESPVEAPPQGVPVIARLEDPPQESPPGGGVSPVVELAQVPPALPAELPPALPAEEAPVAGRPVPPLSLEVAGADLRDAPAVEPFELPRVEAPPVEEPRVGMVAPVVEAAPAAASVQALDPGLVAALMRRGTGLMELGDISAARLAFGRAAAAGEAAAATALGRTYDPGFLNEIGGRGIAGDSAEAARWYRQGREMGDPEAEEALARLGAR